MDPELLKAARMYFDQMAKAKAAGDRPSATERENYARQLTGGSHGYADIEAVSDAMHEDGGNAYAPVVQGATANFGDELLGLVSESAKQDLLLRGEFQRREHPVADVALQGMGGVGSALALPVGRLAEGASLAQKMYSGAKVGAAFGAANGVGAGEDMQSRAVGGLAGGAGGAVVGAVVPRIAATRAAAALGRGISRVAGAVMTPLEESYAKLGGVRNQIEKSIESMGGFRAARDANMALAAGGRGAEARFADLGKPTTDLADFAAVNSSKASKAITDVVDQRAEGTTARVLDDFKAAAGDQHAPTRQAQLAAETKAWADGPDGYGTPRNGLGLRGAMKDKAIPLGDADPLVTQPRIKQMFATAKETGQIGPVPEDLATQAMNEARAGNPELDRFLAMNPKLNVESLTTDPDVIAQLQALGKGHLLDALKGAKGHTFDNVQDLHSTLEDAASAAFRRGENNLGFRLAESASVVSRTLEETVPGYADIVDKYAARKGLETASKLGQEWFHKKADVTGLNAVVKSLKDKPLLLEEFRRALASEQIVALQRTAGANSATKMMIAKNNLAQQNMNKIVFGNQATYDQFMLQAKAERQLGMLARAGAGSQTASRVAAREDALGVVGDVVHGTHKPSMFSIGMRLAKKHTIGPFIEHRADELTPYLLTKGTDNITQMLDMLEATSARARVGVGSTRAAPGAITSLFGSARPRD